MKKKTQDEFERDVAAVNPEIQILGKYVNNATNIKAKCKKCGRVWDAVPTKLINHYQCPLCKKQRVFESFLANNLLISHSAYRDNFSRVNVQCKKCRFSWDVIPKLLKKDPRCPRCSDKGNRLKWTNEKFVKEMQKRSPNIVIEEKYNGYEVKIRCQCNTCGFKFAQSPHQLLTGKGCPRCNGHHRWSITEFENKIIKLNPNIIATGFTGIKKKVHCKCNVCGCEWEPIADDVIRGHGCPRCAKRERLNFVQFKEEFELSHPTIEILDTDVKTTVTMINCYCKRCGNVWLTNIARLKDGNGCNLCNHSATSFMEQAILQSFRTRLGKKSVLSRNKSAIGKELDIYIPSKNIAFEPGGWSFHKYSKQKDAMKRQLCKIKGIRLITIYDNYPELKPPFPNDCLVYGQGLGETRYRKELKKLIDYLFRLCDISPLITSEEWKSIQKYANEQSMHKSSEEILKEIQRANPNIRILDSPTRLTEKVLCHCNKCDYEWKASPVNLRRGIGCPKCGGTKKLTQEEFDLQLKFANPKIIALEKYKNISSSVLFHCNECGYEWKSPARWMIRKENNCPVCKKKEQLIKLLMDRGVTITDSETIKILDFSKANPRRQYISEEFSWIISKVNPSVEVVGNYTNMDKTIKCKCVKCGNIWYPKAQHILNGHGCPICNNIIKRIPESKMENALALLEKHTYKEVESMTGISVAALYRHKRNKVT